MGARLGPLALALGVGAGLALALSLGAYALGWGATLAFPATALVLSLGAWKEDDGHELAALLRFALGFTGGYLVAAVPLTWFTLDDETAARLTRELWSRWAVIALSLPGGIATLIVRGLRERSARRSRACGELK